MAFRSGLHSLALALMGCASDTVTSPADDAVVEAGAESGSDLHTGGASTGGARTLDAGIDATGSGGTSSTGGTATGGAAEASAGAGASTGGQVSADSAPSLGPRQAACSPAITYGDPLPQDRVATPVMRGFGFIEGPVWLESEATLFFSDMDFGGGDTTGPPSIIRKMTLPGGTPVFDVLVSSGSNGLALAGDGRILAATHDVQSLSYFEPSTGARENWPLLIGTARFNSPNDLVVRADANVYFTDPDWQLGSRTSETGVEGVYRVAPNGTVSLIDDTFDKPNGITLSPDEQTLYVGGRSGGIHRFALDGTGVPSAKTPFASGGTDGMTVDCAGNVYVTDGDVIVFDESGSELGRITLDRTPSNVAFGGADRTTLFITGGDSLFEIELNVPGMPY